MHNSGCRRKNKERKKKYNFVCHFQKVIYCTTAWRAKLHPDRRKSFIMIWMTRVIHETVSALLTDIFARSPGKLTDYLYQIYCFGEKLQPRESFGQSQIFTTATKSRGKKISFVSREKENSESIQVCIFSALLFKYLPNVYQNI